MVVFLMERQRGDMSNARKGPVHAFDPVRPIICSVIVAVTSSVPIRETSPWWWVPIALMPIGFAIGVWWNIRKMRPAKARRR